MPDRKVLKGIKPFNRFVFRTCYYHQLIAAYSHYGIDARLLVMNYFPLYDRVNFQTFGGLDIFTEAELEELSGVRLIRKLAVTDIVEEIIAAIGRGIPVMAPVDCFYLKYREETYKKKHMPHFILVYGYDRARKAFTINEHNYVNSPFYIERETGFGTIRTAYANYIKRLHKSDGAERMLIKRIAKKNYVFSTAQYLSAYKRNEDKIKRSLGDFVFCCEDAMAILSDKERFEDGAKKTMDDFGYFQFKKKIQKYQMAELFADESIDEMNYRCMDNLVFIYGILAKFNMTKKYDEKNIEKLRGRLKETVEIETKLFNLLRGKCDAALC